MLAAAKAARPSPPSARRVRDVLSDAMWSPSIGLFLTRVRKARAIPLGAAPQGGWVGEKTRGGGRPTREGGVAPILLRPVRLQRADGRT